MTVDQRILCVTCSKTPPRRATPGYMTCDRCADLIRECLQEIPGLYATLEDDESLLPVVAPGGRRGPGFGSRSPANDLTIVLTDPRTTWTAEQPYHNALGVLESWARMVREDTGEAPPEGRATVSSEVALLIRRLDFVTRQPWVDDLWKELREVRRQLGDVSGERRPLPVGKCPTLVGEKTCGTPLWAPLDGDTIQCRGCRREWTRREWLHLGQTLGVVGTHDGSAA